jgi:hypothetical protein
MVLLASILLEPNPRKLNSGEASSVPLKSGVCGIGNVTQEAQDTL